MGISSTKLLKSTYVFYPKLLWEGRDFAGNQANTGGYTFKVKNIVYDSEPVYKNKMAHVHLQMYYNGIHVIGGDSVLHIDATTKALSDFTKTMKYPIKTTPSEVSAAQAQVQAQTDRW